MINAKVCLSVLGIPVGVFGHDYISSSSWNFYKRAIKLLAIYLPD